MSPNSHPFQQLTPDLVMDAVESQGFSCDSRIFALNSYENRVYQVGIDDAPPLIAKFYRPNRWSEQQIQEEHNFCFELVDFVSELDGFVCGLVFGFGLFLVFLDGLLCSVNLSF